VSIYRQEWCRQLQFFFNKDGCQLQPFFNNGGRQPLTFGKVAHGWCNSNSSCCICQWTVLSINGYCTLMATNPTDSSNASVVNSSFMCFWSMAQGSYKFFFQDLSQIPFNLWIWNLACRFFICMMVGLPWLFQEKVKSPVPSMELEKENKQIEDTDLCSSCIITFLNIFKLVFIRWSRFRAQHKSFFFLQTILKINLINYFLYFILFFIFLFKIKLFWDRPWWPTNL